MEEMRKRKAEEEAIRKGAFVFQLNVKVKILYTFVYMTNNEMLIVHCTNM